MRIAIAVLVCGLAVALGLFVWRWGSSAAPSDATAPTAQPQHRAPSSKWRPISDSGSTNIYAHNLKLRKGDNFRIYVRWFRGQMRRTRPAVNPSFDDLDSFYLDVQAGVIHANIGDIANFLNANSGIVHSPLRNLTLAGDGNQIRLRGTLHKIIPLPVELLGEISAAPNNQIHIHVTKINVLKIPFKGLLGGFHITLADFFNPKGVAGIQVTGNDIFLDSERLLPPPHIRGELTAVRFVNPDLEEVYGNGAGEVERVDQWRNFLRLRGGTIDFGRLTMHPVDILMVDISDDAWFDLDLAHYQEQLVYGYTHMTPQAGLQIFMPDIDKLPKTKAVQSISMEWLRNRNEPPPADVYTK